VDVLGIIAGGGELPLAVARSVQQSGREVFVLGLRGWADPAIGLYSHDWVALGETRKMLELLHAHHCKDVLMCGRVSPSSSSMRRALLFCRKFWLLRGGEMTRCSNSSSSCSRPKGFTP
jgi:DUF1009 family protein